MSIEFDNTLTPKEVVERLKTISFSAACYRLIPSRFPPVPLYQRIAPTADWDIIAEVEGLTNPRLRSREKLGATLQYTDPSTPKLQNWNHAPFTNPNPEGTTFFWPITRCLETGDCLQTALAAAIIKRERFLSQTSEAPTGLDMRVLKQTVKGHFVDASGFPVDLSQEQRWALGKAVSDAGHDGIIFRPGCRPAGRILGILNSETLEKAEQAEHFRFVWDGTAINQVYSFSDGKVLSATEIFGRDSIVAA